MYNIPFSPPDISQDTINEVIDTLKSGWITTGPKTQLFEDRLAKYIGTNKVVTTNSATSAMELVLRVLGIGPGDEVITSAYTYTASASVINHVGAKIVLVDTQKDSLEMDYDNLEQKINKNTKAIIAVDIAGKICDYETIYKKIEKYNNIFQTNNDLHNKIGRIAVIADGAHSFGATREGVESGNFADFTCYSFHAVKNLTTSEGGAITWNKSLDINNEELYRVFKMYGLHGQTKDAFSKMKKGNWEYDIEVLGYKTNMTDISASIGISQLKTYEESLKRRKEIVKKYDENLQNNIAFLQHIDKNFESSCHLYLTWIDGISELERNTIIEKMAEKGIATNVHYKPLPLLTAYKKLGFSIDDYPNAYNAYKNEISLPIYPQLTDEEVQYIIEQFNQIVGELND
ncbi:DegT/DnrJ/EryC1/StrS family aminotransferase [Macrococcus armenti]|uniref:DegT/DnrJ/EryC1/StrS family aminotransferase n=1 Tax=Macrococcus armenti TaxID=2875764 RepID=UPI001CD3C21A|nr:DegT/DnrJ/EryC1/StrS family aminotransferase [Macrococcus armenti]UBH11655.1 DegT/DnrJ/EryC1/StrS family aminotransferase [Macrococcus armenti]